MVLIKVIFFLGCDTRTTEEVDLENYVSSPRKLKQNTSDSQCFDDSSNSDQWQFVRTSYYQNPTEYIHATSNQPAQEIVTTRVCVELGVITNGTDKSKLVEAPTIVLCSVDVEPCPGKVVELNEVTVKTIGENNNPQISEVDCSSYNKDNASAATVNESMLVKSESSHNLIQSSDSGDMLEKISHDLDYLLNRTPQDLNVNSTDSVNYQRKSLLNNIKEEEEEICDNITTKSGLIAKTSL